MPARTFRFARAALMAAALIGTAATVARPVRAQVPQPRWELVIPGGKLIPTGSHRDAIQTGGMTAAQLAYVARPSIAVTATFGWARSRDVASVGQAKLDVFLFEVALVGMPA